MSFKSIETELTFEPVIKLFQLFNKDIDSHVQKISNPQGGECFWVLNSDKKKKRYIKVQHIFIWFKHYPIAFIYR